jgi:CHAT domain-containing protein/tetratricopeptide (TPR) repeat protein
MMSKELDQFIRPPSRGVFLAILFAVLLGLSLAASGQSALDKLAPGKSVERELTKGETHSYPIALDAGQYLSAVINQEGIAATVRIYGADGRQVAEASGTFLRQRRLFFVAEIAGEYRLEISAANENAGGQGRYEVKIAELRPATDEDRSRFSAQELATEVAQLGSCENATNPTRRQMVEKYQAALAIWRKLNDRTGEQDTLFRIGVVNNYLDRPQALANFNQALALAREIGDRWGEELILENLAEVLGGMGEHSESLEAYEQSLAIARELKDHNGELLSLYEIALVYINSGEAQQALNYNYQLLAVTRPSDSRNLLLHSLCKNHLLLGEPESALDYCQQALSVWQAMDRRLFEAATLSYIGNAYSLMGEPRKELEYYNQALEIFREVQELQGEAGMLNDIGAVYHAQGEQQKALECFEQALALARKIPNIQAEANTQRLIGEVYWSLGDREKALDCFNQALSQLRSVKDHSNEAATLLDIARAERDLGRLTKARGDIETALSIVESVRAKVTSLDLRASYLATKREYYEFYIDLLMRFDARQPDAGYAAQAFQVSERARARSLVESLAEARIDTHQGIAAALIARERTLKQQLSFNSNRLTQLLGSRHGPQEAAAAQQAIDVLLQSYAKVESDIRTENPHYASLAQPEALNLPEVQAKLLDQDTLLLEYSLGEARSFVWVVTPTSFKSFELPGRSVIEAPARRVYELLTARSRSLPNEGPEEKQKRVALADEEYPHAAAELSRMLLGPVASQLGKKRLLIVAEGALQYVPFASLPIPVSSQSSVASRSTTDNGPQTTDNYIPLVVDHEIVSLPSASVLAALRQETSSRSPASKTVAVLADPVFSRDDSRVSGWRAGRSVSPLNQALPSDVVRSAEESGLGDFVRLRFSRAEADAIARLAREGQKLEAVDFVANRSTATSAGLQQYRIVHFATHGLINSQHPELSGIVLSLVDQNGQPQNGFLRLYEIYNLRLNADLVVLSACQTALGKEIKGEGLIGLTRGFMYAGAPRVVASLWRIDDRATAELMTKFYRGMLKDGLPPAAALRAAQISIWKGNRWSGPHYWAAFTIQGEWK